MKKALLGIAVLLLSLLAARVALADARYTDPTGDSGGAPDIAAVNVTNDAAGNLTFTVPTNQSALAADAGLSIWFNTDMNTSTGDDGIEYALFAESDGWGFERWDGSQYVGVAAPSASSTYVNGSLTFKINKADLGNVSGFAFYVVSAQFNAAGELIARDDAPDGTAVYTYLLTTPPPPPPPPPPPTPLTLKASAPIAVPAKPAAGKAFSVRIAVTRGDTGGALASGVATCNVKVGLKPLRAVGTVRAGKASCAMAVPATAHGKMLRGTIKVTFKNVSVTKAFSYRVP